jgi:hypothetical protein
MFCVLLLRDDEHASVTALVFLLVHVGDLWEQLGR